MAEPAPVRWPVWAVVALAALFLQAGGRLLIEAADLRRAQAHVWQGSRRGTPLSPGGVTMVAAGCLALTGLLGFIALIERGWPLFWLGLAGVVAAVVYSQGPALRDRTLGPALSFLLLGPAPVVAGYYAVIGTWSALALRISLPLGFLAAAVALAREIRDSLDDQRAGATTMGSLLRRPLADYALVALLAAAYLSLVLLVARGILGANCLLPLLTLPAAIRLLAEVWATRDDPAAPEPPRYADRAARLYILFAALYAVSVAASEMIWRRAA